MSRKVGLPEPDWNEPPLQKWLNEILNKGTQKVYRTAYRFYSRYVETVEKRPFTSTELIDEALEDAKRDIRERKNLLKQRLLGFYNWMTSRYEVRIQGKEPRIGLRPKTAHAYVMSIRSFYQTYDLAVKLKGRSKLPRPRVYNKTMPITTLEVKALINQTRSPRDRAIILAIFQGGMDESTLCSMKYGDIARGIGLDEQPLKLELFREKSGTDYYTFLGRDAIEVIKAYLNDARSRGITFKNGAPLWFTEEKQPLKPHLVQKIVREAAIRAGLVDEENNGKDLSPVRPHALREAFGSIMINNGVPDAIVDFWLGHTVGEMSEAYKGPRLTELKAMYVEKERFISVNTPESEVVEGLRQEIGEKNKQLQTLVNGLTTENLQLKSKLVGVELELTEFKKSLGEELAAIRRQIEETAKSE